MAFSASVALPISSPPKFPIKLFGQQRSHIERCLFLGIRHKSLSKCAVKVSMPQFGGANGFGNGMPISVVKEKFVKSIPEEVKEVEWKKVLDLLLSRLLHLGQKILKWSIIAFFALSSLSDAISSISRNQELVIPFGLLVGCLVADLLKEISLEVFPSSQGKGLNWKLIGIGFFFFMVKSFSGYLAIRGKVFLLHVANGGFLQVLWLWRKLVEVREQSNQDEPLPEQDTSVALGAKG